MVEDLKGLIIRQLKTVYGNVKVYDEPVQQGLKTPAFLLLIPEDSTERKLGRSSAWEFYVSITYFPADLEASYAERDAVSQTFREEFRYIGRRFLVQKLQATKSDGALVLTFNVKKLVREIESGPTMQELEFGGVSIE